MTIIPSIAPDVEAAAIVNAGRNFECIYVVPAAALNCELLTLGSVVWSLADKRWG